MIDASELIRDLRTIESRLSGAVRQGLDEVAKVAYREARGTTLFKDQTGELRGSLDIVDRGTFGRRLVAPAEHASHVEGGTPPHIITAKNAGMLRFMVGGKVVYARQVSHPGTSKRPFMQAAAEAGAQVFSPIMDNAVTRVVEKP